MELKKSISFTVGDFNYELKPLKVSDVTLAYVEGLERERGCLENVPLTITVFSQRKYVQEIIESVDKSIIGLFFGDVLVGTAGLQRSGATWVVNKKQISGVVTLGILVLTLVIVGPVLERRWFGVHVCSMANKASRAFSERVGR